MSRHSKNNTANSIFTYGEKQKVQEWGTIKARVGSKNILIDLIIYRGLLEDF